MKKQRDDLPGSNALPDAGAFRELYFKRTEDLLRAIRGQSLMGAQKALSALVELAEGGSLRERLLLSDAEATRRMVKLMGEAAAASDAKTIQVLMDLCDGNAGGVDLGDLMVNMAADHDFKGLRVLGEAKTATDKDWLRAAYELGRAYHRDEESLAERDRAVGKALALRAKLWERAAEQGFQERWELREKGAYERECEAREIPLWSASAVPPLDVSAGGPGPGAPSHPNSGGAQAVSGVPDLSEPEGMAHWGSAVGALSETLLWGDETLAAWSGWVNAPGREPERQKARFEALAAEWEPAKAALAGFQELMADQAPTASALASAAIQAQAFPHFLPFMLVWGDHRAFDEARSIQLAPLVRECRIDASNAGLVAANIDFCSFNARVARLAMACNDAGVMDGAGLAVINARLEDLWSNPKERARVMDASYLPEIKHARSYFKSHAEAARLREDLSAGAAKKAPRARI